MTEEMMIGKKKAVLFFFTAVIGAASSRAQSEIPFARYKVIPHPSEGKITVEVSIRLQNRIPFITDFGQIQDVRWMIGGKEVSIKSERLNNVLMFNQAPATGEATVIYSIKTKPMPLKISDLRDIHLAMGPDFVYVFEGLFLGLNGMDRSPVDVQWQLPSGWSLAMGQAGRQTYKETQKRFWVAGRTKYVGEKKIGDAVIKIAILERPGVLDIPWITEGISKIFEYAWREIGPLPERDFGIAVFPKGSLPYPGWSHLRSIVVDEPAVVPPHEILHLWMNNLTPAWFREGVLEYMTRKIMMKTGILNEAVFRAWLRASIVAHNAFAAKTGRKQSLAASSAARERGFGGGEDIYTLMPVLAFRLDKEIQKFNPKSSLDEVFYAACRKRHQRIDILGLIKEMTGYDPNPLFKKYFFKALEKPEELLEDR